MPAFNDTAAQLCECTPRLGETFLILYGAVIEEVCALVMPVESWILRGRPPSLVYAQLYIDPGENLSPEFILNETTWIFPKLDKEPNFRRDKARLV